MRVGPSRNFPKLYSMIRFLQILDRNDSQYWFKRAKQHTRAITKVKVETFQQ